MSAGQNAPQLQMIWPLDKEQAKPQGEVPEGYALRTYQPGDETRFFSLMKLAGWPDWNEQKLKPWLFRILPQGWFMITEETSLKLRYAALVDSPEARNFGIRFPNSFSGLSN